MRWFVLVCLGVVGWSCAAGQTQRTTAARKPALKAEPAPDGPVVVMDTSLGRLTCRLYSTLAPVTSANFVGLVSGTKAWTDPMTGTAVQGRGFYDGIGLNGISDGIIGGDRMGGGKGVMPSFPAEKTGLGYERGGRLAMAKGDAAGTESGSLFYVTADPNLEFERRGGVIFGQCDDASMKVVAALSHALLSVDNFPDKPLAVNKMVVVQPGDPLPPIAAEVPAAQVTPQPAPVPVATLPAPEPTGPRVLIETSKGTMHCQLFTETPIATANFVGLATGTKEWKSPVTGAEVKGKPFYDGLHFGRVIPDFMVQNADEPGGSGKGDIGFKFGVETVPGLSFDRPGRLAYANGGPNTNASEFFVTEHAVRRLDGLYTIFGQCDDAAVDVVKTIARVPRDDKNKPLTPVVIRKILVVAPTPAQP